MFLNIRTLTFSSLKITKALCVKFENLTQRTQRHYSISSKNNKEQNPTRFRKQVSTLNRRDDENCENKTKKLSL